MGSNLTDRLEGSRGLRRALQQNDHRRANDDDISDDDDNASIPASDNNSTKPYSGDLIDLKGENVFRGASCQVNRFPVGADTHKYDEFFDSIKKYEFDVTAIQEVGINHNKTSERNSWHHQVRTQLETAKTIAAFNQHNLAGGTSQWGGTALLSNGNCSKYAFRAGVDPTKLGRWCWARYRGSHDIVLRVVSLYRPNPPPSNENDESRELSVYKQHLKYFNTKNDDRDPRDAFIEDFKTALSSYINSGDQVIVCGDFNDDIFSDRITSIFTEHGMHHMVFCRHDPRDFPASCERTHTTNRTIDGIWGTANLIPIRCGYLEAGDIPGDHCPIWFDISYETALGHNPPPPSQPDA